MSGKKGKSGPPQNLNAVRDETAWRVFWKRRAVRAADRWVPAFLESYAAGLEADKPGMGNAEARMAEIAATARGCTMLILSEAKRSGFIRKVDGSWDLAPGAVHLARFLNVERAALANLGLERRARPALSLEQYLETHYTAPAPTEAPLPAKSPAVLEAPQAAAAALDREIVADPERLTTSPPRGEVAIMAPAEVEPPIPEALEVAPDPESYARTPAAEPYGVPRDAVLDQVDRMSAGRRPAWRADR